MVVLQHIVHSYCRYITSNEEDVMKSGVDEGSLVQEPLLSWCLFSYRDMARYAFQGGMEIDK